MLVSTWRTPEPAPSLAVPPMTGATLKAAPSAGCVTVDVGHTVSTRSV